MVRLIVFDLDGTLAESKMAIDSQMSALLGELLAVTSVAIISGGDWPQFVAQVVDHLKPTEHFHRLSILPTSGTKFYQYDETWKPLYEEDFTTEERETILKALKSAVEEAQLHIPKIWGEQIEDRGTQITFSALGQKAPLDAKKLFDPDFKRRQKIKAVLDKTIPDFSVRLGGATSIDITKVGIDKAYGIQKLRTTLGISIEDMIYVGDALFPGGNDYAAITAGVNSIRVAGPGDTKVVIETVVACLNPSYFHANQVVTLR